LISHVTTAWLHVKSNYFTTALLTDFTQWWHGSGACGAHKSGILIFMMSMGVPSHLTW